MTVKDAPQFRANPDGVTCMEHWGNEHRRRAEEGGRNQDPGGLGVASEDPRSREDSRSAKVAVSRNAGAQDSTTERHVTSRINWQSALYVFVLGCICVLLVPLTSSWWIVPVLGMVVPVALIMLDRPGLFSKVPNDRKVKERELLEALVERGELSPTTAAVRTSLTVDEASKMLEKLAHKGHLKLRLETGIMAYALRDRPDTLDNAYAHLAAESESDGAPRRFGAQSQLDVPLSERELEVLSLLASGRTNSEVAKDLFISVGTVKSHTGNIYRKLEAKNRAEALARARELKVLQ
jgi:DNA-binding CsgD family transcriptional regulator